MGLKENLKAKRKELDLTLEEAAVQLGIKRSTLQRYESGIIANVPSDKIERLAEIYATTPAQLMGWDSGVFPTTVKHPIHLPQLNLPADVMPITVYRFPLYGEITSGSPKVTEPSFEGYVEVGAEIRADFCVRARGDSMINARIQNGDIVFIREQSDVEDGEIAAVIIDEQTMLKRIFKHYDIIQLQAENPKVKPIIYRLSDQLNIRILGKAVAFQSDII